MTNLMTSAIDWQKTEAQYLKVGSRFRLNGMNAQGEIEIFTVRDISREPWTGRDTDRPVRFLIETKTQEFWFQDSDIVLTAPKHEKTVFIEGDYFYV